MNIERRSLNLLVKMLNLKLRIPSLFSTQLPKVLQIPLFFLMSQHYFVTVRKISLTGKPNQTSNSDVLRSSLTCIKKNKSSKTPFLPIQFLIMNKILPIVNLPLTLENLRLCLFQSMMITQQEHITTRRQIKSFRRNLESLKKRLNKLVTIREE